MLCQYQLTEDECCYCCHFNISKSCFKERGWWGCRWGVCQTGWLTGESGGGGGAVAQSFSHVDWLEEKASLRILQQLVCVCVIKPHPRRGPSLSSQSGSRGKEEPFCFCVELDDKTPATFFFFFSPIRKAMYSLVAGLPASQHLTRKTPRAPQPSKCKETEKSLKIVISSPMLFVCDKPRGFYVHMKAHLSGLKFGVLREPPPHPTPPLWPVGDVYSCVRGEGPL